MAPDKRRGKCARCGKDVVRAETRQGKIVHLDPAIRVYELDEMGEAYIAPDEIFFASHKSVCKYANGQKGEKE